MLKKLLIETLSVGVGQLLRMSPVLIVFVYFLMLNEGSQPQHGVWIASLQDIQSAKQRLKSQMLAGYHYYVKDSAAYPSNAKF